jgi:site-specific DNA-methyltransferase (adenine-specific)
VVSRVHFSKGKDNWGTPPWLFDRCSKIWDFQLDACAEEWSAKCDKWYGVHDNGLLMKWQSWTWCNPPYSEIELWLEKAAAESHMGASSVVLIPSRTDTKAFHKFAPRASRVFFIKGRLKFIDPETQRERDSAPFPSMLLEFGTQHRKPLPSVEFISWLE